jgi:hypothetical protein
VPLGTNPGRQVRQSLLVGAEQLAQVAQHASHRLVTVEKYCGSVHTQVLPVSVSELLVLQLVQWVADPEQVRQLALHETQVLPDS